MFEMWILKKMVVFSPLKQKVELMSGETISINGLEREGKINNKLSSLS